jgi:hypothetical protein
MAKMTIDEMIEKFRLELAEQNGEPAIKISKKPTDKQLAELKAAKPQIIGELQRRKEERDAEIARKRAENEAIYEKNKAEYLANTDLRRFLVCWVGEFYDVRWSLETLEVVDANGRRGATRPRFGHPNHKGLLHITPSIQAVKEQPSIQYGMGGVVWEITPEQEAQILAEQVPAAEAAQKEAEEKARQKAAEKADKEAKAKAELQAKFDEAAATGKPVVIRSFLVDCSDPREECSTDNVVEYAMPDGTTERKQYHTW